HGCLQIVTLGSGHTYSISLNAGLYLEFAVFDETHDFFCSVALDAIANLDDLLDFVTADFFDFSLIKKAYVNIAFSQFGGQYVTYLAELKFRVGIGSQLTLFLFNARIASLEIETRGNFLASLVNGIFDFNHVGFGYGIK